MLNLRKKSLQIGFMILAVCGSALDAGSLSTAFAATKNSISYSEIASSSALPFETLSTDSPIQVAKRTRRNYKKKQPCKRCKRCKKSLAFQHTKNSKQEKNEDCTNEIPEGYRSAPIQAPEEYPSKNDSKYIVK